MYVFDLQKVVLNMSYVQLSVDLCLYFLSSADEAVDLIRKSVTAQTEVRAASHQRASRGQHAVIFIDLVP